MLTKKQRENCRELAKILIDVPPRHFDMRGWAKQGPEDDTNFCGSSGCAMGWAAMSGQIDDLGWAAKSRKDPTKWATSLKDANFGHVHPLSNGKIMGWEEAARRHFGDETLGHVFAATSIDRAEAVGRLLKLADYGHY